MKFCYILLPLFFLSISNVKAQTEPIKTYLDVYTQILNWANGVTAIFGSISDKDKREEASDKLTWLLNDIDKLYTNELQVISVISSTDSVSLLPKRIKLREKSDNMTIALQDMLVHLQDIKPLLNATIYGTKTDTLVSTVEGDLLVRKGRTLDEIEQYLSGSHIVSKARVVEDGNKGLRLLQQCKAKLSALIRDLKL
jgi:hypothetical protein